MRKLSCSVSPDTLTALAGNRRRVAEGDCRKFRTTGREFYRVQAMRSLLLAREFEKKARAADLRTLKTLPAKEVA